ncbi:hypothetical protein L1987_72445 [Smallanthus sonchifolius]|uniref:Uncharacterized protein n=1 Tax=Smallanthus sonchifolius TaxID=185202 RepID=A0ACB9AVY4_9ASTR|nr:hypothetical protein L1987_72445 [Smallanthus sonchifolius]
MNPINGFPKFDMLIPLSFAIDRGQMMLEWRREEWSQELPESVLNRRRTGRSRRRRSSSSNGQLPVQDSEIGYSVTKEADMIENEEERVSGSCERAVDKKEETFWIFTPVA